MSNNIAWAETKVSWFSNSNLDHLLPTQSNDMKIWKKLQASFFDLEFPMTFPQKHLSIHQGNKREIITYEAVVVGSYRILVLVLRDNFIFYVTL